MGKVDDFLDLIGDGSQVNGHPNFKLKPKVIPLLVQHDPERVIGCITIYTEDDFRTLSECYAENYKILLEAGFVTHDYGEIKEFSINFEPTIETLNSRGGIYGARIKTKI